ncbi:MAG: Asp-tRNA(Asn)/Glu-tRNA(Gln) amidotransferase subunit GatA [Candidatus Berkelbacteria bacterium]|nr:Asp-tRNA(Asn)/Glu-tRNA(Gln) amidotransferase subunit GatA [Candidatus Berkelbacteria bacterium]
MELNKLTIKEAAKLLKEKKITSLDLTKACFERINKLNKKLNAYISIFEKEGMGQARASDQRRVRGLSKSEIDGIPLAIKDNINIEGSLTTCGSSILSNYTSSFDATVIEKLKKTGAVFLGKTNMDEFAMGSSTETSYFGPTKNPWDISRVPGGSSGGSAAAVAADMCIGALGSDTGGSIRQPASLCGTVGLKPTYGMVSRYGLVAMASSLDQIGPITKTVEDAKILYKIIAGYDPMDSTSVKKAFSDQRLAVRNTKIGVPKEYFVKGMDKEVEKVIREAIKDFEKLGYKIVEVSLPYSRYALAVYYVIMPSEVSSNMARYDGIKYGMSEGQNLLDVYMKSRAEGLGDEVKRRIMLGTFALSSGYYDAYYLKAKKVQTKIKEDFDKAFEKADCLLTPTSPTVAFKINEKTSDPLTMYLSDIFTVPINIAGVPAISIPCGLANNMPVGLQIIGPQFGDQAILNIAQEYEQNTGQIGQRNWNI